MRLQHGENQNIAGRHQVSEHPNIEFGVGGIQEQSRDDGIGQIRINKTGGEGFDSSWSATYYGETPSGKILQRLELVEKSHTEYVRAHQTRLKARLDESEKLEEIFNNAVNELRQEIYNLATEAESNGNGHLNGTT